MAMTVDDTLELFKDKKKIYEKLKVLHDLGLGYLTLGEDTPALSGGEAQRLKLASEMGRTQEDSVFVFDEPTIGLHPLDVQVLLGVFDRLVEAGATVLVIEHDLLTWDRAAANRADVSWPAELRSRSGSPKKALPAGICEETLNIS